MGFSESLDIITVQPRNCTCYHWKYLHNFIFVVYGFKEKQILYKKNKPQTFIIICV